MFFCSVLFLIFKKGGTAREGVQAGRVGEEAGFPLSRSIYSSVGGHSPAIGSASTKTGYWGRDRCALCSTRDFPSPASQASGFGTTHHLSWASSLHRSHHRTRALEPQEPVPRNTSLSLCIPNLLLALFLGRTLTNALPFPVPSFSFSLCHVCYISCPLSFSKFQESQFNLEELFS